MTVEQDVGVGRRVSGVASRRHDRRLRAGPVVNAEPGFRDDGRIGIAKLVGYVFLNGHGSSVLTCHRIGEAVRN